MLKDSLNAILKLMNVGNFQPDPAKAALSRDPLSFIKNPKIDSGNNVGKYKSDGKERPDIKLEDADNAKLTELQTAIGGIYNGLKGQQLTPENVKAGRNALDMKQQEFNQIVSKYGGMDVLSNLDERHPLSTTQKKFIDYMKSFDDWNRQVNPQPEPTLKVNSR